MISCERNLLIVEHDVIYAGLLARAMAKRGYRVETVNSSEEASERLRSFSPTFTILDVNLNGISGIELIPEILHANACSKIIVITSYGNLRAAARAVRLGATDVIAKPISVDELEFALERPRSQAVPGPESITAPNEARDAHIVEFYEKYDRNVTRTARKLAMHRRTVQRLLRKSKMLVPLASGAEFNSAFGRARRMFRYWSRVMQPENKF